MTVRVFEMTKYAKENHFDWDEVISRNEIETVEEIEILDGENVDDYMSIFYPQYEDGDKYGIEVK